MRLFVGARHTESELDYLILSYLILIRFTIYSGTRSTVTASRHTSLPKTDHLKDKAVLYLTDVFGLQLLRLKNRARHPLPHLSFKPCSSITGSLSSLQTTLLATASRSMNSSKAIPSLNRAASFMSTSESFPPTSGVFQGSDFDLKKRLPKHATEHTGKRVRKVTDGLKERHNYLRCH